MKKLLLVVTAIAALTCLLAIPAFSADKLIVKDSATPIPNTKFVVTDTGLVSINTGDYSGAPSWATLYSASNGSNNGLNFSSFGTGSLLGGGGMFSFARGTATSKSAVQYGDRLGFFVFSGYDGGFFENSGGFTAKVDGAVSAGVVPVKLAFETGTTTNNRMERMVISSTGNVGIGNNGPTHLLTVGTAAYSDGLNWYPASSREYKENIQNLSAEKAMDAFEKLNPVTYVYKEYPDQGHVGFIAEDVPDLLAMNDRKHVNALDIVAVLTKVVQEQNKTIADLSEKLNKLETQVARIKSKDMFGSVDPSMTSGK